MTLLELVVVNGVMVTVTPVQTAAQDHEISSAWQEFETLTDTEYQADGEDYHYEFFAECRTHLMQCNVTARLQSGSSAPAGPSQGVKSAAELGTVTPKDAPKN